MSKKFRNIFIRIEKRGIDGKIARDPLKNSNNLQNFSAKVFDDYFNLQKAINVFFL
jgi:hypothetical protein